LVFGGDPKLGKSHLLLHCAAVLSHGGEWPCREGNAPVGSTIVLSAEDSPHDTIIPRLLAYRANMDKIHIVEATRDKDGRNVRGGILRQERRRSDRADACRWIKVGSAR